MVRWSVSRPSRGSPRGDPQRLEGPQPRRGAASATPRPTSARRPPRRPAPRRRRADDGEVVGHVGDLDAHHEPHPVEELDERGRGAGLGVRPSSPRRRRSRRARARRGPAGLRIRTPVHCRGASASRCWVVSECSQVSRSGPETRMTSRWERSTKPRPAPSVRCSERAVVRRHVAFDAVAGDGAGREQARGSRGLSHSTHRPKTARWPTSTTKPCSRGGGRRAVRSHQGQPSGRGGNSGRPGGSARSVTEW